MRQTTLENAKSWLGTIPGKLLTVFGAIVVVFIAAAPDITFAQSNDPNARVVPSRGEPLGLEEQAILLKEIEAYFNTVDTLQTRFFQINMDGSVFHGDLMLNRPGKMRIDYDDPIPYKIISDGTFYIFIDEDLEETSYIPLGLTPANMLLRHPMKLDEDLIVLDAARADGALFITVAQKETVDAGNLTFVFTEKPLALQQWSVVDTQGIVTRVILNNPVIGIDLDPDLFVFVDPWVNKGQRQ